MMMTNAAESVNFPAMDIQVVNCDKSAPDAEGEKKF